jgi:hypothetical protein
MSGAVKVNERSLAWLNNYRDGYPSKVGRAGTNMICSRREWHLNGALIETVSVINNLARKLAIVGADIVTAMMASGTLVDKVTPRGINYQVTIGFRMSERLRSRTDGLNDRLLVGSGAGGQED